MDAKIQPIFVRFVTLRAFVRFFASMGTNVGLKMGPLGELVSAVTALERFLTGVNPVVLDEVQHGAKLFPTRQASVWFISRVQTYVRYQLGLECEALAAVGALVRLLLHMQHRIVQLE
jgi:hypothetical protein